MRYILHSSFSISLIVLLCLSCATVQKRMPAEMRQMHGFLTQDNPDRCRQYHYNFERQVPRLYSMMQVDSILNAVEFIKSECGPSADVEITRMLVSGDDHRFDDSLIGTATIAQMLWYRAEHDFQIQWSRWYNPFEYGNEIDNTHERFQEFEKQIARKVAADSSNNTSSRIIGEFFSDDFDSALAHIQQSSMRQSALNQSFQEYVGNVKRRFPSDANFGFSAGSWAPQGDDRLLGKHPELGMQIGAEEGRYRADFVLAYRFSKSKNSFIVDSLGQKVSTTKFNSWLIGCEGGYKFLDGPRLSTDIFAGLGYDVILSVIEAGNPDQSK